MRREQEQMAAQQQGMQQQASSQLSTYNRAVAACTTGRGYTVEVKRWHLTHPILAAVHFRSLVHRQAQER